MTTLQDVGRGRQPEGTTRAHWWILVVIAGAQLMVVLDSTIMIIALPSAQHSLGFSNTDRQWVVTAYTLAFGGFLLLGGRISDMFGPKRTLMTGVLGFALASAIGGAAQTTLMLIGARGPAGPVRRPLAPSVLVAPHVDLHRPAGAGRAFGIYATIAIAGSAFGLILGGFLTQYVDWRWCLYVNLPIAVLVLFGASTMIPNRTGARAASGSTSSASSSAAVAWSPSSTRSARPARAAGAPPTWMVALAGRRGAARLLHPLAEQGAQSAAAATRPCGTATGPGRS